MTDYLVDGSSLTAIANAIRTKGGTSAQLTFPQGFVDAIGAISGGGSAETVEITDVSNATGTTAVISAVTATKHTIHLEFSDSTDTDIYVYYDDALIGTMITAYEPTTYGGKTVTLAQLDGVTWYEPSAIPINQQLIDYSKCIANKAISNTGAEMTQEWYYASDYTPMETGMSVSYRAGIWFYIGFYDANKDPIAAMYVYQYATQDPNDSNTGFGNISGANIPAGTKYMRLCGTSDDSSHMSLIRTA